MISIQRRLSVLWVACVCCFLTPTWGEAQTTYDLKAANTSSPRDTLRSFIDSCNQLYDLIQIKNSFDRADPEFRTLSLRILDCLDTRELPAYLREERAAEVSVAIKEILDRIEVPPWEEIPGSDEVEVASGDERLLRWRMPETRLLIARATSGEEQGEYMFAPEVVRLAVRRYREMASAPYRTEGPKTSPDLYRWYISAPGHRALAPIFRRLPNWLKLHSTLRVANWKWPGILLALAVAMTSIFYLYRLYWSVSDRFINKSAAMCFAALVFPIAAMLVPILFQYLADSYLAVRSTPIEVIRFGSYLVALIAAVFVTFATANRLAILLIALRRHSNPGLDALIHISAKLMAVIVTLVLLMLGGQFLGIPVATLLASAGIGGIAVALAAQDTLKNLFATLTLMADRPCSVGDLIKVEQFMGFVEDIGMRTAKLRLVDGTLLAIPNEQLAGQKVENLSRSRHIRRKGEIQIPLDTPSGKLDRAVAIIRDKLDNHECMDPARPPRIFLEEFTPPAFRIVFRYYYCQQETGDDPTQLLVQLYWKYKAFNDRLNFEILRAFESEGISLVLVGREEDWRASSENQLGVESDRDDP
jgi:MscS family membrane protein